jgi:predicted DNA-binding transcriptional regulator AlpA
MAAVSRPETQQKLRQHPPTSLRHDLNASTAGAGALPAASAKALYIPEDPLLCAREGAIEAGQSLSTFWRNVRAGKLPKPIYVSTRSPRWRRSEIRAALEVLRDGR